MVEVKHRLTKSIPSFANYWRETDAIIAAIDDGIENHVYSDHIIPHHKSHSDNSSTTNSTGPNYYPSNSHLVVFWGVVAHLIVFFLSLMYQCCINDATTPLLSTSSPIADDIIVINDGDNTQSHG